MVLAIGATGLNAEVKGGSLSLTTSVEIAATGPELKIGISILPCQFKVILLAA